MKKIKNFIRRTVLSLLDLEDARKLVKTVVDPLNTNKKITFTIPTYRLDSRANSLANKEPGTIRWLDNNLKEDDIFYDIGANVGIYTLFAANRLSDKGKIVAFEPHAPNFNTLIENILLNDMGQRTIPVSFALGDSNKIQPFLYRNIESGSSGSQLSESPASNSEKIQALTQLTELKQTYTLDSLVKDKVILPPDLIKIDVDGNELNIVKGMTILLKSTNKPRSVQIEVDPELKRDVLKEMEACGYKVDHLHFTRKGQQLIDQGHSPDAYPHNIVFTLA